jgi:hypothetical protein
MHRSTDDLVVVFLSPSDIVVFGIWDMLKIDESERHGQGEKSASIWAGIANCGRYGVINMMWL